MSTHDRAITVELDSVHSMTLSKMQLSNSSSNELKSRSNDYNSLLSSVRSDDNFADVVIHLEFQ